MAKHGVSSFDKTIPRVKAFGPRNKRFALVDVDQLDGSVGLLTDIDCTAAEKQSRRVVGAGQEKAFKYVIRPGKAFKKDISLFCGNVKHLF